jgi:hypothetical protein
MFTYERFSFWCARKRWKELGWEGRVLRREGRNTWIGSGSGSGIRRGVLMGGILWCYSEFMVAEMGSAWRGRKALGDSESDGGRWGGV